MVYPQSESGASITNIYYHVTSTTLKYAFSQKTPDEQAGTMSQVDTPSYPGTPPLPSLTNC
jgi:hypothetical protein